MAEKIANKTAETKASPKITEAKVATKAVDEKVAPQASVQVVKVKGSADLKPIGEGLILPGKQQLFASTCISRSSTKQLTVGPRRKDRQAGTKTHRQTDRQTQMETESEIETQTQRHM